MRVRCEYCGSIIEDTDAVCPQCGAPNDAAQPGGTAVPQTIEELKSFCAARSLPLAQMRFFLGQDVQEARAFGIYQDEGGRFVVYKNKADGTRAVRYRGADEAYAVNEIYQKLKSEIANQRDYRASRGSSWSTGKKTRPPIILIVIAILAANLLISSFVRGLRNHSSDNGYYYYNDSYYYNQSDVWYAYDDALYEWVPAVVDEELSENYSDYYESSVYSNSYGVEDFSDSSYYVESDQDSDWDDDDWDWGGSDWDSGSTDWDSDW